MGLVAVEWSNVHLAGAFLLGAVFATVATLRVVRAVTTFFAGYRPPPRRREDEADDDEA